MPTRADDNRITRLLQWTVTIAVAGAILAVLYARRDELLVLVDLTVGLIVAVSVAALLQFITQGLVLKYMFEHFRATVGLLEAAVIGLMDATLNYLPMKAGTIATGAVAVKRYTIRISEYAAGVAGATIVNMSVCSTVAGALLLPTNGALGLVLLLGPVAALGGLIVWGRSHTEVESQGDGFRHAMARGARGLQSIYADHGLLARLVLTNIARLLAVSAQLYFSFQAVSTPISVSDAIIIGGFATVLGRLSIIPGGLGFREGGVVGAAALVGIDPTVALAASVIDRAVIMAWLVLLGLPSTIYVSSTTPWRKSDSAAHSAGNDPVTGNYSSKYETTSPLARKLVARFRRDLDELRSTTAAKHQLDIGCGEGLLAADWARDNPDARIVGLDLDDAELKEFWGAIDRPNLDFVSGSAMDLPFDDNAFDVVSAIEVLEHVPDPEQVLAEAVRVARDYVIVSVPREPLWRALNMLRGRYLASWGNTPGHVHHWSGTQFRQFLEPYGTLREVRTPTPWTIVLLELER